MKHSKNFKRVKTYYKRGLWSAIRVKKAVGKWITAEEYNLITSEAKE